MTQRHRLLAAALLWAAAATPAIAQEPVVLDLGGQFTANGEAERYLRVLQLLGKAPMYPVGSRPWTRHEATRLAPTGDHPWAARFAARDTAGSSRLRMRLLRPSAGATLTSGAPHGEGEGAVWLGKGLTVQSTIGARVRYGMLDVQVAPMAFWTQNADFELAPTFTVAEGSVRDPRFPHNIDAPQRFGLDGFGRIDPGYSRIGVDSRFVSAGASTSPLAWGPARDEPLVLGPGAGGFLHGFVGTGEPLPIFIGKVHVKLIAGRLEQSDWSPVSSGDRSRMATAAVVLFEPRGVPGLEVGVARFEHRIWRPGVFTLANVTRPFTGILNDNVSGINSGEENGYASGFLRWAVAPHGIEVYAEYAREDYTGSLRWLLQKPDDLASLLVGAQRVFAVRADRMNVLRAEVINGETSSNEIGQRGRILYAPYLHSGVNQGHTLRGQLLGSPSAFGGAGWTLALDQYRNAGRTTWTLQRRLVRDWAASVLTPDGPAPQVSYQIRGDRMLSVRDGASDLTIGAGATWVLNEHIVRDRDRVMFQLAAGWRGF